MKALNILAVQLLALSLFAVPAKVWAQHEHHFEFRIVGNDTLFGGTPISVSDTIAEMAIHYSLRNLSSPTDTSAFRTNVLNEPAVNYPGISGGALNFSYDLGGIDLTPIGGPDWDFGVWGVNAVADVLAGFNLAMHTHIQNARVAVDYPFEVDLEVPEYNRGDLVEVRLSSSPIAADQTTENPFVDLSAPNFEKALTNAFALGLNVGVDVNLGPFTGGTPYKYRVVNWDYEEDWTVMRAGPDGFYGDLGLIARPELMGVYNNVMSGVQSGLDSGFGLTNQTLSDIQSNSSLSNISDFYNFVSCAFGMPAISFPVGIGAAPNLGAIDGSDTFELGPFNQNNFQTSTGKGFYQYTDENDPSQVYYSNLCMTAMPLLGSMSQTLKLPTGRSRASNTTTTNRTQQTLTRTGSQNRSNSMKVPLWMLVCQPTIASPFGLGTPANIPGMAYTTSLFNNAIPGLPSISGSAVPWFSTAPQVDIFDMYGISMTMRRPASELFSVPTIGSDFSLSARTTNNTEWFELRHNFLDTFESVLEMYCPIPLPTPQCAALAAIEMRKSEDNAVLQALDVVDNEGKISIWQLSTGGLSFVTDAIASVACATSIVNGVAPGNPLPTSNSFIDFLSWGVSQLSDLDLLKVWVKYNLLDIENKFSISNAFDIDYGADLRMQVAFTDSTGAPIARDVRLSDGTLLTDTTSVVIGLNDSFEFQSECDDHTVIFVPTPIIASDSLTVGGADIFADSVYVKLFNFDAGLDGVQIIPEFTFEFLCTGDLDAFANSLGSCAEYALIEIANFFCGWFSDDCLEEGECETCRYGFPGLATPSWSISEEWGQIGFDEAYNLATTPMQYAVEDSYELTTTQPRDTLGGTNFGSLRLDAREFSLSSVRVVKATDDYTASNGRIDLVAQVDGAAAPILAVFDEYSMQSFTRSDTAEVTGDNFINVLQGRYANFQLVNPAGCPADVDSTTGNLWEFHVVAYLDPEMANWCGDVDGDGCNDCALGNLANPLNDGADADGDGLCDAGDPDDDNDGIPDAIDGAPNDPTNCGDNNLDGCDDCTAVDYDGDGICNSGDLDDDNDGRADGVDPAPLNPASCGDADGDGCDDCGVQFAAWWAAHGTGGAFNAAAPGVALVPALSGWAGFADTGNDGPDFDRDGLCDSGDPDDDNDGVADASDSSPKNPTNCSDLDADGCDDCCQHWTMYHATVGCQTTDAAFAANWTAGTVIPNLNLLFNGSYRDTADDSPSDADHDGICDANDPDRDNDGAPNGADSNPTNPLLCADADGDGCDDCTSGTNDPMNDGPDFDGDGVCDFSDTDDDNDGMVDANDSAPFNRYRCNDTDNDGCDDCNSGTFDVLRDGPDFDAYIRMQDPAYPVSVRDSLAEYTLRLVRDTTGASVPGVAFIWHNDNTYPGLGNWVDTTGFVTNASGVFAQTANLLSGSTNRFAVNGYHYRLDTIPAADADADGDGVPGFASTTLYIVPASTDTLRRVLLASSLPAGSAYSACFSVGVATNSYGTLPDTVCTIGRKIKRILAGGATAEFTRLRAWSGGVSTDITEEYHLRGGAHPTAIDAQGNQIPWTSLTALAAVGVTIDSIVTSTLTAAIGAYDYFSTRLRIPADPDDFDASVCGDSDGDTCDDCEANFLANLWVSVPGVTDDAPGTWNNATDGPDADGDGFCTAGDLCEDLSAGNWDVRVWGNAACMYPPTVDTQAATAVTDSSATLNAAITTDGGSPVTQIGFRYGLNALLTSPTDTSRAYTATPFATALAGLSASTPYWAVAYATNAMGTSYGDTVAFTTPAAAPAFSCGTNSVTYDGHAYATVTIGTQCWLAENLRNTHYNDGTAIPGTLTTGAWTSATAGAQAVYGEGTVSEASNLATYGRLYNWHAVNDVRGLCPSDWHVPTDAEWTALATFLGGSGAAGAALKASSWDGTNSAGFGGLPGGFRSSDTGNYSSLTVDGNWWTSSLNGADGFYRYLDTGNAALGRFWANVKLGFSVRCMKD